MERDGFADKRNLPLVGINNKKNFKWLWMDVLFWLFWLFSVGLRQPIELFRVLFFLAVTKRQNNNNK